ncbi:unnamed protein product [Lactuca virosa]|uniref:Uncharacterized protein n=1 Tax=Lactuca virosa TaxID=75947 RepID=A0AAU9MM95_9ASTR|nr:unnamed protein product [Lactuca virosa]
MNSNEVLEDHSIEPSKILSDPVVSNQFHDPDAIISNPLGKPSPVSSDHALVIGESSTSIVGFRNPNDPIPLNSSVEKIKQPLIFSAIPIQSYNINAKPGRPKRDQQSALALCSPYHKKEVNTTECVSRLEERVAGSLFLVMCNPKEKVYESTNGFAGIRSVMESLIPGCRIHRDVIDLWSAFLNDLEKYKGRTTPSRFFMPCSLMTIIVFKKMDSINA